MELFRALGALAESPGPEHGRLAEVLGLPGRPAPADYAGLFMFQLYPYASIYLGAEGMIGGEARDRVAGFWRALGRTPPPEPDHLVALLALYAELSEDEEREAERARRALRRQARKACLWEHMAPWLFAWLDRLDEIAPPFYRAWGMLLREALAAEVRFLGLPDALPAHLRDAPLLPDPRDAGLERFLRGLLAPVRSGLLLVRQDFTRLAREAGLGHRLGERQFTLRALLEQDPVPVLGWLAAEAGARAAGHARGEALLGSIARFWAERARASHALLAALRDEAGRLADSSWSVDRSVAQI